MFKPGDIVRRKESYQVHWLWSYGSETFRVKECNGPDVFLHMADGSNHAWAARKFELALPQTFNDDEWE